MFISRIVSCALAAAALGLSAASTTADERPEIRSHHGAVDAVIQGAVQHGDRDIFPVALAVGQTMTIDIASPGNDVRFQVYPPTTRYYRDEGGRWVFSDPPLWGSEHELQTWTGTLRTAGQHLIVVQGLDAVSNYSMRLQVE
ncbi:MAG: hypothetical protein J0M36_08110 [Caulobacterales bacterium]|nr:hypothetical protein [Caulobacterales bacterium]